MLLDHGADVAARGASCDTRSASGWTSLHQASYSCDNSEHLAVVQTLLDHGADVAARDNVGAAGGRARECIAREDALDPMS